MKLPVEAYLTRFALAQRIRALLAEGKFKKRRTFYVYRNTHEARMWIGYNFTSENPGLLASYRPEVWEVSFGTACMDAPVCNPPHIYFEPIHGGQTEEITRWEVG